MKLQCRQCGALLAVTSPDAYISCPYCGARSVVSGYDGASFLHRPSLGREDALRLFEPDSVASVSLFWFPYDADSLSRVFTQPYAEMENYLPPSADRRLWNESEAEGKVVPVDPKLLGEGGVVYHPFWVVINAATAQGTMVDAVSGGKLGAAAESFPDSSFNPSSEAFSAFLIGIGPALLVFFLLRGVSIFWASVFGMASAIFAPDLWKKLIGGKNSE